MTISSRVRTCRLLQRQMRFQEVHRIISNCPEQDPDFNMLQYIRFEIYLSRLDYKNAEKLYQKMIEILAPGDPLKISFNLRMHAMRILSWDKADFDDAIHFFKLTQNASTSSDYNVALAYSLHARALETGVNLGIQPARQKHNAIMLLETSISRYKQSGHMDSYAKESVLLAELLKKIPFPNRAAAREVFQELLTTGRQLQDSLISAQARLGLLEFEMEDAFNAENPAQRFGEVIKESEAISAEFHSGGHLLSDALVKERFGVTVMKYGVNMGMDYLADAIEDYHAHQCYLEEQNLHRQIATWHLEHGNTEQNIEANKKAAMMDQSDQSYFGSMVSYLALINRAYQDGRIDRARSLYEQAVSTYENHPLYSQLLFLQANNLGKIGLRQDSVALLKKVVAMLSYLELSPFLSDAYTNLAANLIGVQTQEALNYILKAIDIDQQTGDHIRTAQHIQLLIQILIQKQLQLAGKPLTICEEIYTRLRQSEEIIAGDHSLKSQTIRGQIMQSEAYALYLARRYVDAINLYETAEGIFIHYELKSNLAFLYSHMGLTIIEQARIEHTVERYEQALGRLSTALGYFEISGLKQEQARTLGLIATSLDELGRLISDPENARQRWEKAEEYYERSYQINRFLRAHADSSSAISKQLSMIAFVEESQTYTQQAFYLHLRSTKKILLAVKWLERIKAQALVTALEEHRGTNELLKPSASNLVDEQDRFVDVGREISHQIPDDVLIIEYFYTDDTLFTFGMRKAWTEPKLRTQPFDPIHLEELIQMHFSSSYGNVRSMLEQGLDDQWQAFGFLLEPAEQWCAASEQICFVPYGLLHQLPLHTLKISSGKHLIERNPVFYNQSLSVMLNVMIRAESRPSRVTGHNYVFGNSRGNLRFAEDEAVAVARILNTNAYIRGQVTREAVMNCLPDADFLHISGHGELADHQGWENGLLMAGSQKLTAADIISCTTTAELVVLSGCDTGGSQYHTGDELTGLVRSFIYAGAERLIVSLWKVNDAATSEFYSTFYSLLKEHPDVSTAVALQRTILKQIGRGNTFFYWGAFQLIGNLG